ncbi:unnamed protein product [Polarella glacialis]|uniref:Uncharacterized protein n=1 Tax=Polarella glacialis TaxID=89957 RepID=A0A813IIZ9_POLGL|nr:unnamed protein product [Polarella glacialis]
MMYDKSVREVSRQQLALAYANARVGTLDLHAFGRQIGSANEDTWSVSRAISIGPICPTFPAEASVLLLDREKYMSLRFAVSSLTGGYLPECQHDFVVCWSDSSICYLLLYREGCKDEARRLTSHVSEQKPSTSSLSSEPTIRTSTIDEKCATELTGESCVATRNPSEMASRDLPEMARLLGMSDEDDDWSMTRAITLSPNLPGILFSAVSVFVINLIVVGLPVIFD